MKPVVKSIKFEEKGGMLYAIIEFSSYNVYRCYDSVDELIIKSDSPLMMEWTTEYSRIYWDNIKQETKWCAKHWTNIKGLYNGE